MYSTKGKNKIFAKGFLGFFFGACEIFISISLWTSIFIPQAEKELPRTNQFENILFYSLKVFYTSAPHAVTLLFHLLMNGN